MCTDRLQWCIIIWNSCSCNAIKWEVRSIHIKVSSPLFSSNFSSMQLSAVVTSLCYCGYTGVSIMQFKWWTVTINLQLHANKQVVKSTTPHYLTTDVSDTNVSSSGLLSCTDQRSCRLQQLPCWTSVKWQHIVSKEATLNYVQNLGRHAQTSKM